MTVVPDTNVLIAALIAKGLGAEVVLHAIRQRSLASSTILLDELEETLRRKFAVPPAVGRFLELLRLEVRLVEPVVFPNQICRDADDDAVLGTAVAPGADLIVTGARDLLVLESFQGIRIVTPRQYLELVG